MADTDRMKLAKNLLNTSVDDCQSSIKLMNDIETLRLLKALCVNHGHKTRLKCVNSRIRQLQKAQGVKQ